MKRKLTAGQTSVSLPIFVQDTSSTTGGGLSGLTSATSGLVAEYRRRGQASWTAITLTSKTLGTWTSGGLVADGALAGAYELDLPDAVCASGQRWVAVRLRGAANMLPCLIEIELDSFDYQVATQPVNVTQFGGTNGTFSSGRPEVNATHVAGTSQTAGDIYALETAIAGYIDTEVAAIKAKTDQLTFTTANKVDSTAELDSASLRSALGMSAADLDDQLDAILAAATAGAGTGARTVTITVNDGTTALQNAIVRFTEGSNTFRAVTNASGVAVFNLDDATYTVAVTKSGYTYAGTTMVVNGTETATYSMTAVSVTPPTNPDLSAIEVLCLDEDFAAAAGIEVDFRMSAVASGDQNRAHPGAKKTITSNVNGIARFEGPQGATIEWKRGTGQQWTAVTLDNDSVTNVTSLIGSP